MTAIADLRTFTSLLCIAMFATGVFSVSLIAMLFRDWIEKKLW